MLLYSVKFAKVWLKVSKVKYLVHYNLNFTFYRQLFSYSTLVSFSMHYFLDLHTSSTAASIPNHKKWVLTELQHMAPIICSVLHNSLLPVKVGTRKCHVILCHKEYYKAQHETHKIPYHCTVTAPANHKFHSNLCLFCSI